MFCAQAPANEVKGTLAFFQTMLEKKPQVDYLGATITANKTSETLSSNRIWCAHKKLQLLKFGRRCRILVPVTTIIRIYRSMILPTATHDLYLAPHFD